MALIQLGSLVTDIRGKVSGTVFSKMQAGNVIRNKTSPSRYRSNLQSSRNAITSNLSSIWLGLSQNERDSWNNLAHSYTFHNKLGQPVPANGFFVFQIHNRNLTLAQQDIITDAPIYQTIAMPGISVDEFNAGNQFLKVNVTLAPTGYYVFFYCSRASYRPGTFEGEANLKLIDVYQIPYSPVTVNLYSNYLSSWGMIFSGQYVKIGAKSVDPQTGAQSTIQWIKSVID
jgi:hypothetical protein